METFYVKKSSQIIPEGTQDVEVVSLKLKALPKLPDSVRTLDCRDCTSLRKLPKLPKYLTRLSCNRCTSLTELPELPENLQYLWCNNCILLKNLPTLPKKLKDLDCAMCTSLTELPVLPKGIGGVYCDGCVSLLYLPKIPIGCLYIGAPLPTEKEYFKRANRGANQKLFSKRGDEFLYRKIGYHPTDIVKSYLSFGRRKSR
jgi:hypothetical protein